MKKLLSMLTVVGLLSTSAGSGILANSQTTLENYSAKNMDEDLHYWSNINLSHSVETKTGENFKGDHAIANGSTKKSWDFFQQTNVLFIEGNFEWHNSIKPLTLSSEVLFVNENRSNDSVRVWEFNQLVNESNSTTTQANYIGFQVTASYNWTDGTVSLTLDSYILSATDGEELPCSTTAEVDQIMFFHL